MTVHDWLAREGLRTNRRHPLAAAVVFLLLFIGSIVLGSVAQQAAGLPWEMGWVQQGLAALVALAAAYALREPRTLPGLHGPDRPWLAAALGTGVSIALLGTLAGYVAGTPPTPKSAEWFLYEAIAPGLGEELGLRGVLLALLGVGLARFPALDGRPWLLLLIAAVPFAALHLLELSGLKLLAIGAFTLVAGLLLGALRLRTASIWPAVLAHNLANVLSGVIDLLLLRLV